MVVAYRRGSFRSVAQRDLGKPANFSYRPRRMDNRNAETQGLIVAQNHAARLDQSYDQSYGSAGLMEGNPTFEPNATPERPLPVPVMAGVPPPPQSMFAATKSITKSLFATRPSIPAQPQQREAVQSPKKPDLGDIVPILQSTPPRPAMVRLLHALRRHRLRFVVRA